jgi:hypothetical protein
MIFCFQRILLCICLLGGVTFQGLQAQSEASSQQAEGRTIRPKEWQQATRDLDYSRDKGTESVEIGELEMEMPEEELVPLQQEPQQGSGQAAGNDVRSNRQPTSQEWQEAQRDLDYSRDKYREEEPKPLRTPLNGPNLSWGGFGQFLMYLMLGLLGVALLWMVYVLIREPRNRKFVRPSVTTLVNLDNLEDHIHETDLERYIREALEQGNYNLAVRIYYLQIIKDLSLKNLIVWKREKTNRDYSFEMESNELGHDFKRCTFMFELAWYGNTPLQLPVFRMIENQMKDFLNRIPT